jgi:hypothetical protein
MSWTTVRAQTRPPRPRSRQTALTPSEVVFTLSGVETRLEFEDEIPIPLGNLGLYRRIYVLEQVVATVRHGRTDEQVRDAVAERYTDGIWGGASAASQTVGIADVSGCRVQRHVVWLLTLEELRRLLLSDFLWPSVKQLTGLQKADVASRVEELREIRNVIGHNRATTGQTARIFEGIEGYLGSGVERFRQESGSDRDGSSDFPRVRPPARTRTRRALPRRALLRPRLRRAPV